MNTKEIIASQQAINRKLWAKENGRMHSVDANRLIAEFMGWDIISPTTLPTNLHLSNLELDNGGVMELKFHTSWDWLMPVAESCFERLDVTDTSASEIQRQLSVCDKAGVYEAIVEFIKQYNND